MFMLFHAGHVVCATIPLVLSVGCCGRATAYLLFPLQRPMITEISDTQTTNMKSKRGYAEHCALLPIIWGLATSKPPPTTPHLLYYAGVAGVPPRAAAVNSACCTHTPCS